MKRILFLLLLTVSVYGQNPSRFAKIQITGNSNSGTATKVNVQEANGEVNTQTINTGFNKNIGLGGSDVVGANTLLNQYSTTPVDWIATSFNSGQVVFYSGKQWIAKMATVAGDVPSVSSKWEEITFDALANKMTTVDQTIIDGSTNSVSGNAVFDGLATKAPISSVHNPVTIGTANGLSLSTQQLSLGLASSSVTGALSGTDWNTFNGKFNTPTGLTTNYLPKWNGSGFGDSQIFDNGTNVGIGTTSPYNKFVIKDILTNGVAGSVKSFQIEDASGGNTSFTGFSIKQTQGTSANAYFTLGVNDSGYHLYDLAFEVNGAERIRIIRNGNVGIGTNGPTEKIDVVGNGKFSGTISASPATTANQVPTWGQVQAAARPYKVYTAVLTQQNTNAPSAVVLENTLGGTVVWTRNSSGNYYGTLNGAFPIIDKIALFQGGDMWGVLPLKIIRVQYHNSNTIQIFTQQVTDGALVDNSLNRTTIEIRVYN